MPVFELNHRLPSSFVDKALVETLEEYLGRRLAHRAAGEEWKTVEITHRAGRSMLSSVSAHASTSFQDDTQEIAIVARVSHPQPLEVLVQFSVNRRDSFVRLRYTDDESRQFLVDMLGGIERLVLEKRTWNSWFRPDLGVSGLLDGLAVGVLVFVAWAFTGGARIPRWMLLTSLVLPFYRVVGYFKPYTSFQTPQTETLRMVANWLTAGLAGFALLLTLGAYFDIRWLGF